MCISMSSLLFPAASSIEPAVTIVYVLGTWLEATKRILIKPFQELENGLLSDVPNCPVCMEIEKGLHNVGPGEGISCQYKL